MTRYVAFLRAINVGGRNMVAMRDLRRLFVELGCRDVTTRLQSGNVLFMSGQEPPAAAQIEAAIAQELGVSTRVLLRSRNEMAAICAGNPFVRSDGDLAQLYVAFLGGAPDTVRVEAFGAPGVERFRIEGTHLYLQYPGRYSDSKLTNAYIEQRLDVVATTRNWRVTTELAALLGR